MAFSVVALVVHKKNIYEAIAASLLPGQETTAELKVRGMVTGSKQTTINDLGNVTGNWLINVVFYGKYDRPIQAQSNNHLYLTVADKSTVVYDFVKPVITKSTHYQNVSTSISLTNRSDYDNAGRVLKT